VVRFPDYLLHKEHIAQSRRQLFANAAIAVRVAVRRCTVLVITRTAIRMLKLAGADEEACAQVIRRATRPNGSINVAWLKREALEAALPVVS
jgi:hypothetical protein